ncbi:hypothetical protein [Streptomyces sp. x-80]
MPVTGINRTTVNVASGCTAPIESIAGRIPHWTHPALYASRVGRV